MIGELIEKINFLFDYDLSVITLLISLILGSAFAIPNALRPAKLGVAPLPPFNATALSILGSCARCVILILFTLLICKLLSNLNYFKRLKVRINSSFFTRFNQTTYTLYPISHKFTIVLFLSTLPFLSPIISCLVGYFLGLDLGRNFYCNLIGTVVGNLLMTLYAYNDFSRLMALILFALTIIFAIILTILPYLRIEKKMR